MSQADLLIALANAGAPVRPAGSLTRTRSWPLRDSDAASEFLEPFLGRRVHDDELSGLHALQRAAAAIVQALLDGTEPSSLDALNRLAASHRGVYALEQRPDGRLTAALHFEPAAAGSALATRAIRELGALDLARLRRCARPECSLAFYDTTRSGTRRWHSDSPCGNRERQRRHRGRRSNGPPP